jgi:hypothetical protein
MPVFPWTYIHLQKNHFTPTKRALIIYVNPFFHCYGDSLLKFNKVRFLLLDVALFLEDWSKNLKINIMF